MHDIYQRVAIQLFSLEGALRDLNLWAEEAPEPHRLRSTAPFACDLLSFPAWLQFIFLPRMHELVEARLTLPSSCSIEPYAQEWLASQGHEARELLALLRELDTLITDAD